MPDFLADAEKSRQAKTALRSQLLASRRSRTNPDRRSAAAAIHSALQALVRQRRPSTIAAYVPIGSEPGADLPSVLAPLTRILLPVLLPDGDLDWVAYDGTLQPGARGLLEPVGLQLGVDAVVDADLVIVPALAVDGTGLRLGRGGGSYDRVLNRLAKASPAIPDERGAPVAGPMIVAMLFDGELVESVPAEPHDGRVHAVITPSGGLTLID